MRNFVITEEFVQKIGSYLMGQPFGVVEALVQGLRQLPELQEIPKPEQKTQDPAPQKTG